MIRNGYLLWVVLASTISGFFSPSQRGSSSLLEVVPSILSNPSLLNMFDSSWLICFIFRWCNFQTCIRKIQSLFRKGLKVRSHPSNRSHPPRPASTTRPGAALPAFTVPPWQHCVRQMDPTAAATASRCSFSRSPRTPSGGRFAEKEFHTNRSRTDVGWRFGAHQTFQVRHWNLQITVLHL